MKRETRIPIIGVLALLFLGLVYLLVNNLGRTSESEPFANPHGNYNVSEAVYGTPKCAKCHSGHTAYSLGLLRASTQRETCYFCHDGGNGSPDVKHQFGENTIGSSVYAGSGSFHPVPTGVQVCTDCHDPHLATEDTPGGTASLLAVGEARVSSGNAVCGVCHGVGSSLTGGDMVTPFTGTPHDSAMSNPSSGTQIKCVRCHEPHGSPYNSLVRRAVYDQGGVTREVYGNDKTLCFGCHINAYGTYSGKTIYNLVYHGTKTASTVVRTVYPGTGYAADKATACHNCHEPHGKTGYTDYRRAQGNALCLGCHKDDSIPSSYSYRGSAAYNNTPHVSATVYGLSYPAGDCLNCHAVHGKDSGSGTPFPKQLRLATESVCFGGGAGACHSSADNSVQKINIYSRFTSGSNRTARHSITSAEQTEGGTQLQCVNCHDPHLNTSTSKTVDPDSRYAFYSFGISGLSNYIDTNGNIFVLAAARHDGAPPVITSGPAFSGLTATSVTINWTTNETSTSYVDYGFSVGNYVYTTGNATLVTSHSVNLSGLSSSTDYHYRVRSTDALGNERISGDYTFHTTSPPPAPTLIPEPDINNGAFDATITLECYAVNDPDPGDTVQYYFEISTVSNFSSIYANSGWTSNTSWTLTVSNYNAVTYYWRVKARDNWGAQSAWSNPVDAFVHDGGPEPKWDSCPFIYAWNGTVFEYVSDMSGPVINMPKHIKINPNQRLPYYLPVPNLVPDKNNQYLIKIRSTAPGEIDILDQIGLVLVDHAPGYEILSSSGESPGPSMKGKIPKKLYAISKNALPVKKAVDKNGKDVTKKLLKQDNIPAPAERENFAESSSYVLDFGKLQHPEYAKLILDGWTFFKKEINVKPKDVPRVEVINKKGQWETVRNIGFVSGDKKSMVVDLSGAFKTDDHRVRIFIGERDRRFILDRARMDQSPPIPLKTTYLPASYAELYFRGPANQIGANFDHPVLAQDDVKAGKSDLIFYGKFTKYGDVRPLLTKTDDMFVIMQHGDEVLVKFDNPSLDKGLERTPVLMADFYYKQTGTAKPDPKVKVPVEPLPFHAMSSYPYPDTEKYPDDPAHKEYRAKWLTREYKLVDGKVVPFKNPWWTRFMNFVKSLGDRFTDLLKNLVGFGRENDPKPAAIPDAKAAIQEHTSNRLITREKDGTQPVPEKTFVPEKHYSLNTNYVYVMVNTLVGTGIYTINSAGSDAWSSGGAIAPTPSVPGTPADSSQKSAIAANDSSRWTTNLVTADGQYNYQMYKFVPNGTKPLPQTIGIYWVGYGEPTTGYDVFLYLWNYTTSSWDLLKTQHLSTEGTIQIVKSSDFPTYCNKCHDNAPPAGVVMGATRNILASYAGDYHGGLAGTDDAGTTIKAPYVRGNSALSCADCHDVHGSQNAYHLRENLNGQTGLNVPSMTVADKYDTSKNAAILTYCQSCHAGTLDNFHMAKCLYCHRDPGAHDSAPPTAGDFSRACTYCHTHGGYMPDHGLCHCTLGYNAKAF